MGRIRKGKIMGFEGTWGSGLGVLRIEDESGEAVQVPCENAPTVRALEAAFGGVIGDGHKVDSKGGHIGQEVYWMYDDMGLTLESFVPVDEATPELEEAYEAGE